MIQDESIHTFLSQYNEKVCSTALELREIILKNLPGIIEQIDIPARMIAYCYGQKYAEVICIIIPSKKGLKLGFNRGTLLSDPHQLLEGNGKISRYVVIKPGEQIKYNEIEALLGTALVVYKKSVK